MLVRAEGVIRIGRGDERGCVGRDGGGDIGVLTSGGTGGGDGLRVKHGADGGSGAGGI